MENEKQKKNDKHDHVRVYACLDVNRVPLVTSKTTKLLPNREINFRFQLKNNNKLKMIVVSKAPLCYFSFSLPGRKRLNISQLSIMI